MKHIQAEQFKNWMKERGYSEYVSFYSSIEMSYTQQRIDTAWTRVVINHEHLDSELLKVTSEATNGDGWISLHNHTWVSSRYSSNLVWFLIHELEYGNYISN